MNTTQSLFKVHLRNDLQQKLFLFFRVQPEVGPRYTIRDYFDHMVVGRMNESQFKFIISVWIYRDIDDILIAFMHDKNVTCNGNVSPASD